MKRYIAILAAALLLACTACGKKQAPSDTLDSEGLVTASTQEMIYKNSSYTLRFTKNEEGKWQWKDDTTLPLDQTLMQQLLAVKQSGETTLTGDCNEDGIVSVADAVLLQQYLLDTPGKPRRHHRL